MREMKHLPGTGRGIAEGGAAAAFAAAPSTIGFAGGPPPRFGAV
jgi:hypothetical protein